MPSLHSDILKIQNRDKRIKQQTDTIFALRGDFNRALLLAADLLAKRAKSLRESNPYTPGQIDVDAAAKYIEIAATSILAMRQ